MSNQSSGSFLFFLDADDWIEPKIEMMYLYLIKNKKYGYVFPDVERRKRKGLIEKEFNLFEQFFLNQLPYCIFISKENFKKYGFMMKI